MLVAVFYAIAFQGLTTKAFGTIAVAVAVSLLSIYVAWRSLKGDEKFALIRTIGVAFGAIGGTSFCGADLTDADFTKAILKSTNFNHTKQKQTILAMIFLKGTIANLPDTAKLAEASSKLLPLIAKALGLPV